MSGYKCYYFNIRGRAEVCRLSLAAANIEYEDVRLSGEEWAKEKACKYRRQALTSHPYPGSSNLDFPYAEHCARNIAKPSAKELARQAVFFKAKFGNVAESPMGQMPFLVTPEGKVLGQSGTIMKYICKQGGLCPADPFDEAVADMICDAVTDICNITTKLHFEKDEAKKKELEKEFFETTLPARLEKFDALLKGPFFFGDKLTYADIRFFDLSSTFLWPGKPGIPEHLDKFPKLVEHYKRVVDIPGIKAWLEKRPKSEF